MAQKRGLQNSPLKLLSVVSAPMPYKNRVKPAQEQKC
nr:MAG TPA: hypothetical protein [Bacteriophage sp.]